MENRKTTAGETARKNKYAGVAETVDSIKGEALATASSLMEHLNRLRPFNPDEVKDVCRKLNDIIDAIYHFVESEDLCFEIEFEEGGAE